ncbi:hypothetical protein ACVOPT_004368 [Enterobacter hormaechei]
MFYELSDTNITLFFEHPRREKPSFARLTFRDTNIPPDKLELILNTLVKFTQGQRYNTQRLGVINFLKPLIAFYRQSDSKWPCRTNDWQIFWLCFFRFYLTDTGWSKASPNTRMSHWATIVVRISDFLILDEIFPREIVVPVIERKLLKSLTSSQMLLGQDSPRLVPPNHAPQKLLVDIDFQMNDADFLKNIEDSCRKKVSVVKNVCIEHWTCLMKDGEKGKEIGSQVSDDEIENIIQSGRYVTGLRGGYESPIASTAQPDGFKWALAVVRYLLSKGQSEDCISKKTLRKNPFFNTSVFSSRYYEQLLSLTHMSEEQSSTYEKFQIFCRFAGILSPLDVTAASCLLTIEHPSFTSESLQDAKLLNSSGKSYLLLSDREQFSILSVDKPRAGSRKTVVLTSISQKIIEDVIRWTAPVRSILKKSGNKYWRHLFLGVKGGGILGNLAGHTRFIGHEDKCVSLTRLFPVLKEEGLITGRFDFRRIRNTVGILKWFETGSVKEMSRTLGNSSRVVVEHYLPPALMHAWNCRIIRRFQNTLIILAAYSEDYLASVSDFSNMEDLQVFIEQLLTDYPSGTSPLANEVQFRLANDSIDSDTKKTLSSSGVLNIRLSVTSLSYLYAFSDFAQIKLSNDALIHKGRMTNVSPEQLVELARMLRHACESPELRADLSELLDMAQLRSIHLQALAALPALKTRFSQFSLCDSWGEYERTGSIN